MPRFNMLTLKNKDEENAWFRGFFFTAWFDWIVYGFRLESVMVGLKPGPFFSHGPTAWDSKSVFILSLPFIASPLQLHSPQPDQLLQRPSHFLPLEMSFCIQYVCVCGGREERRQVKKPITLGQIGRVLVPWNPFPALLWRCLLIAGVLIAAYQKATGQRGQWERKLSDNTLRSLTPASGLQAPQCLPAQPTFGYFTWCSPSNNRRKFSQSKQRAKSRRELEGHRKPRWVPASLQWNSRGQDSMEQWTETLITVIELW